MRALQKQCVVEEEGQKTAVILSIGVYEELLEDFHDLSIIAERRDEPTITFEDVTTHIRSRME
uniref:Antitoxin n=1 Tax=Candidatus Methanogaster sp. ANME-2c ERB4 TaxID=2759911 RepID=A0A7G9YIZ3_9EURY|nr:hypothetical protein KNONPEEI_00015 [Methanosarcinales archaeon ANME-2c ERB4]QNO48160.1 hypothetical protein GOJLPIDM_00016 [Methanosarcinales archaeon ANME-2c ERB4]